MRSFRILWKHSAAALFFCLTAAGPGRGAGLPPVSVDVDRGRPVFDFAAGEVYTDVRVRNASGETLSGPLELLVDPSGFPSSVQLVTAGGRPDASGAVRFDLGPAVPAGGLAPGAWSRPFPLRFANPQRLRFDFGARVGRPNSAPVLAPVAVPPAYVGRLLSFPVSASDPDGAAPTVTAAGLPAGAAFDGATFRWTPGPSQAGTHSVTFTASDGVDAVSRTVSFVVASLNQPPVLAPVGAKTVAVGQALQFAVSASDPDGSAVTVTASAPLPAGATFDGATFRWTPGPAQGGTYSVTFTASDGGLSASETVSLSAVVSNRAPVLSPIGGKTAAEGQALDFAVSASDPDGTAPTVTASTLPAGAAFDGSRFRWTPDYAQAGTYMVTFSASDGLLTAAEDVVVTVSDVNRPPVLAAIGSKTALAGETLQFGVSASHPEGAAVTVTASPLPEGASFDGATFRWTPTAAQRGAYEVRFAASDGVQSASERVSVTVADVNRPPVLTSIGLKSVAEGATLEFAVGATDPDGGSPSVTASPLPAGATFDGTAFRWSPGYLDAGTYTVTFTATDGLLSAAEDVVLTVTDANRPPVFAPAEAKTALADQALAFPVGAADPDGTVPVVTASGLPAGASFDGLTLRWTPSGAQAGTYRVVFTATDGALSSSLTVDVAVLSQNRPPVLAAVGPKSGLEGRLLSFSVSASDPDGTTPTVTASGLPSGAAFDGATFRWTPGYAQAGEHRVTFTASDGLQSVSETVTLTVADVSQAPVLAAIGAKTALAGQLLEFAVSASSPDGGTPTVTAAPLPDGATFDGTTFRWTPVVAQAGSHRVTFTATLGTLAASEEVAITVFGSNRAPVLSSIGPRSAAEGVALELSVSASDPDGTTPTVTAAPLPAGATFDGTTFRWTPGYEQAGTYVVTFTASDGLLQAAEAVTFTVADTNRAPVFGPVAAQSTAENRAVSFTVTATDPESGASAVSASGLPRGASFDGSTFRWTPGYDQSGSYTVTFTASDGALASTLDVAITVTEVNRAPSLETAALPAAAVDQLYAFALAASDADGDALAFALRGGPNGLTLDPATGAFLWRPGLGDLGQYSLTVTVSDGRGGSTTRDYTLTVPDTVAPSLELVAPAQAIPGQTFTVRVLVADGAGLGAVALAVGTGAAEALSPPAFERQVTVPETVGSGETLRLQAEATDVNGNRAVVTRGVAVVGTPDTTAPSVLLSVPAQVSPGQTVRFVAQVADAGGVRSVAFAVDGQPVPGATPADPSAPFTVPSGAAAGRVLAVSVEAVDFAGNAATASGTATVVAERPSGAPQVTLAAPASVLVGRPIPVELSASDATGVSAFQLLLDRKVVASFAGPPPASLELSAPEGLTLPHDFVLEARAWNPAGNETARTVHVRVRAAERSAVAGRVLDASTGLPLAGATATFRSGAGEATALTDASGRYSFSPEEGVGDLVLAKSGYTQVERPGVAVTALAASQPFDARLTPLGEAQSVSALLGSTLPAELSKTVAGLPAEAVWPGTRAQLALAGGALPADRAFALTQVGPQGLQGLLPLGWSPVAGLDVTPHGVAFGAPAALSAPNALGLGAEAGVVLAFYDEARKAWVKEADASLSPDGSLLRAEIVASGQHAFLVPDRVPEAPAAAAAGDVLPAAAAVEIPADATARVTPEPRVLFYKAGARSEVGVVLSAASPLPSGTPIRSLRKEEYAFVGGAKLAADPVNEDFALFGFRGDGTRLLASWPLAPSHDFDPATLAKGVISLDALAPAAGAPAVIGPSGGTATAPTGELLAVPAGAVGEPAAFSLAGLVLADLPVPLPAGFGFAGGAYLALDRTLAAPAALSLASEASGPVLVARLSEIDGTTRFELVGVARRSSGRLVSDAALAAGGPALFPGVRQAGRYVFLTASGPTGFVAGTVTGAAGAAFPGALVSADGTELVSLSRAGGAYASAVPAGAFALTALDLSRRDTGTAAGTVADGALAAADLAIAAGAPAVVSVSPADGASNVALSTAVRVTFSKPLAPASVTADRVTLTGPSGPVAGSLSLASGDTVAVLRPGSALAANASYQVAVDAAVTDRAGTPLAGAFSSQFTSLDTNPPPAPPAGSLNATIPGSDGRTTVAGTQGTAGAHDSVQVVNTTTGASAPALVEADGSFQTTLAAGLTDKLQVEITDPAGNKTVVPLDRFRDPDGTVAVDAGAARLTAGGLYLDIPAGAFPQGAKVKFTALTQAELGLPTDPKYPFVAGFRVSASKPPQHYLNVSAPLPEGEGAGARGLVSQVVDVFGSPALATVDTAKVIDGRLATASPPCPGVTAQEARYAMSLVKDGMFLQGLAVLGMRSPSSAFVVQPYNVLSVADYSLFSRLPETFSILPFEEPYAPVNQFIAYVDNYAGNLAACLAVPPDTLMKVVVRDAATGSVLKAVDYTTPPSGQSFDISSFFADPSDSVPPTVRWGSWDPDTRTLGPREDVVVTFSEPVKLVGDDAVKLVEDSTGRVIEGDYGLTGPRELTFRPRNPLPMGSDFTLTLPGVQDVAGNSFGPASTTYVQFKSYFPELLTPTALAPYGKAQIASDWGVGREIIAGTGFKDLAFITRTPLQTPNGAWATKMVAVRSGAFPGGIRTVGIDLSDPTSPKTTKPLSSLWGDIQYYQRVSLLEDFPLKPRERYRASSGNDPNVERWRSRELHYVRDNPKERLCLVGETPPPMRLTAWEAEHCGPDSPCEVKTGGCGDLAVVLLFNTWLSQLRLYDVTDPDDPVWFGQRILSDNGPQFNAPRQHHAPPGVGMPKGVAVLPGLDITHVRLDAEVVNEDAVGAYVANTGIGLELVDLGLQIPPIELTEREPVGSETYASRLEYVEKYLGQAAGSYINDVNLVRGKLLVAEGDTVDHTQTRQVRSFAPTLAELGSTALLYPGYRMASLEDFLVGVRDLEPNRAPTLAPVDDQTVGEGERLRFEVTATDPDETEPTVTASGLPSGAVFSGGTFLWTPAAGQEGLHIVTFTASDGEYSDTENVSITVTGAGVNRKPAFVPVADQTLTEGESFSLPVQATDPDATMPTVTASGLPSGAQFDGHTFTWTPADGQAGDYAVTFTATDGSLSAEQTVNLTVVNPTNRPPSIVPIAKKTILEGQRLRVRVFASDPDGTAPAVSAPTVPPGATFDGTTFEWTPEPGQAGTYTVKFIASDGLFTASQTMKLAVGTAVLRDYSFVTTFDTAYRSGANPGQGAIEVVEVAKTGELTYAGTYSLPENVRPWFIDVDRDSWLAFVGATWTHLGAPVKGVLVVDVSDPRGPAVDEDGDGWDDRILGKIPIVGTSLLPAGGVEGLRYDGKRGLLYVALSDTEAGSTPESALAVLKVVPLPGLSVGLPAPYSDANVTSVSAGDVRYTGADGGQETVVFVTPDPVNPLPVDVDLDVKMLYGTTATYEVVETTISGKPEDAVLDLRSPTGAMDPSTSRIRLLVQPSDKPVAGSLVEIRLRNSDGLYVKSLRLVLAAATVQVPGTRVASRVDRVNKTRRDFPGYLRIVLSQDAKVTVKVDGRVLLKHSGATETPVEKLAMLRGENRLLILPQDVPEPGEHEVVVEALFRENPDVLVTEKGTIVHEVLIQDLLPVGHTVVKGVDVYNGHLGVQREDVKIPGLGPQLQFSRTYSSAGKRDSGVMGAGWAHNWDSKLLVDQDAGGGGAGVTSQSEVTLFGGEGSGQTFVNPVAGQDADGNPILTFTPQVGYHGSLVFAASTGVFDYYTKGRTHYRYEQSRDPDNHREYRLAWLEDTHGNRTTLAYDDAAPYNLVSVTDCLGRSLGFSYDDGKGTGDARVTFGKVREERLTTVSGPLSLLLAFDYDEYGNLVTATRADRVETYAYSVDDAEDRHNLLSVTDPNGAVTSYAYYAKTDPFPGESAQWGTDILVFPEKTEFVKEITEGTGDERGVTRFTYDYSDVRNHVTTTVEATPDPGPGRRFVTAYKMSPRGNLVATTIPGANADGSDNVTTLTWAFDLGINDVYVKERTSSDGRRTSFEYDPNGNLLSETVYPPPSGDYADVTDASGAAVVSVTTTYTYDTCTPTYNQLATKTDREGNVTTNVIDCATGDITSTTVSPGAGQPDVVLGYTFLPNGLLGTRTDPNGNVTTYEEYSYGLASRIVHPEGLVVQNSYDQRGRLLTSSDSFGHASTYSGYDDALDKPTRVVQHSGDASPDLVVETAYYRRGEILSLTDGLGSTTYTLDSRNRAKGQSAAVVDADGLASTVETEAAYDVNDNRVYERDARGVERWTDYDALSRPVRTRVRNDAGTVVVISERGYDLAGNTSWETDLHGHRTEQAYDWLYREVRTTLPEPPYATTKSYDRNGNVLAQSDANGNVTRMTYDGANRLLSSTDPVGRAVQKRYDANGNAVRVEHLTPGGRVELVERHVTYDGLNRLRDSYQELTDPVSGGALSYRLQVAYDDALREKRVTNARGVTTLERSNGLDQVRERVVAEGTLDLTTAYFYDANGNLARIVDPQNGDADVTNVYDGLNRRVKATYAPVGGVAAEERIYYDGAGNVVRTVDPRGVERFTDYDFLGRRLRARLVEALSNGGAELVTDETGYDDGASVTYTWDARRNRTTHTFNGLHQEVLTTDPLGRSVQAWFDGVNQRGEVDKAGYRTELEYDAANRLVLRKDFDGLGAAAVHATSVQATYDDEANRKIEYARYLGTDSSAAAQTILQYDPLGRLRRSSVRHPDLAAAYGAEELEVQVTEYDAVGNKVLARNANGNATRFEYDDADRLASRTDGVGTPDAGTTVYTYDGAGNVLTVKGPRDHGGAFDVRNTYDARYRKVAEENALGERGTYAYDAAGNLVETVKPGGHRTRYAYDEIGTLLAVDDSDGGAGGVTRYAYDEGRNRVAQQDAAGGLVTYVFDELNRLTDSYEHTVPGTLSAGHLRGAAVGGDPTTALHWHFEFDANGNQGAVVDARGQRADFAYDYLDRLASRTYSNHQPGRDGQSVYPQPLGYAYTYDLNGNTVEVEERKQTAPDVTVTVRTSEAYDVLNRLTSRTNEDGKTTAFEYDRQGNRTAVTDADSARTEYAYDARERVRAVRTPAGGGPAETSYAYYPDGLSKRVDFPNGAFEELTYDRAGRMKTLLNQAAGEAEPISHYAYDYDANGNCIAQEETHRALGGTAERTRYGYDAVDRLSSVEYPGGAAVAYTYDLNGNRLTETGNDPRSGAAVDRRYAYDAVNRLTAVTNAAEPGASVSYEYDENGNTRARNRGTLDLATGKVPGTANLQVFDYDLRDNLASVTTAGAPTARFDYDHTGLRVRKTGGGASTAYLYDESAVLQEYDALTLATRRKYNYGGGALHSVVTGGSNHYYLLDALHSTSEILSEAGAVEDSYAYDAWGGVRRETGTFANDRKFTGHYFDAETGLHYFGARYYDDATGRFLTQDSYGGEPKNPPSLHRYAYAHANPLRYVDPDGHAAVDGDTLHYAKEWAKEGLAGAGSGALKFVTTAVPAIVGGIKDTLIEAGKTVGDVMIATEGLALYSLAAATDSQAIANFANELSPTNSRLGRYLAGNPNRSVGEMYSDASQGLRGAAAKGLRAAGDVAGEVHEKWASGDVRGYSELVTEKVVPVVLPVAAATAGKVISAASFAKELTWLDAPSKVFKANLAIEGRLPMAGLQRVGHYASLSEAGAVAKQAMGRFRIMSLSEGGAMTWDTVRALERGLAQLPEGKIKFTGGKFRGTGGLNSRVAWGETLGKGVEMVNRGINLTQNLADSVWRARPRKLSGLQKMDHGLESLGGDVDVISEAKIFQPEAELRKLYLRATPEDLMAARNKFQSMKARYEYGQAMNEAAGVKLVDVFYMDHGILPTNLPRYLLKWRHEGWNMASRATSDLYEFGGTLTKEKIPGVNYQLKARFVIGWPGTK